MNDQKQQPFDMIETLHNCTWCPRECGVDRRSPDHGGFCNSGTGISVSSVCNHSGEEPVISGPRGICNIFFSGCNLECVFCQNYQISQAPGDHGDIGQQLPEVVAQIETVLAAGAKGVGFVSPSHVIPQMRFIMGALAERGINPTFVFNTNGYDKLETIKSLDGEVDVWLPDLKYVDERLGCDCSDAPGYPKIAKAAIKEMFRQKGSTVRLDDEGYIESGLIIRHLVLPGAVENSVGVLRWIAEELSPSVHISLMSQYHPTRQVIGHPTLGRTVSSEEYDQVLAEFERLGFYRGWVQELDSASNYRPDFNRDHPFEE